MNFSSSFFFILIWLNFSSDCFPLWNWTYTGRNLTHTGKDWIFFSSSNQKIFLLSRTVSIPYRFGCLISCWWNWIYIFYIVLSCSFAFSILLLPFHFSSSTHWKTDLKMKSKHIVVHMRKRVMKFISSHCVVVWQKQ